MTGPTMAAADGRTLRAITVAIVVMFAGCTLPVDDLVPGPDPNGTGTAAGPGASPTVPSPPPTSPGAGNGSATPSPGTTTATGAPTGTNGTDPDGTPTQTASEPDPPAGVTSAGIENVTALLDAHTAALNRTGYVATGDVNTTIQRSGFLVPVTSSGETRVEPGSRVYYETRTVEAGPVTRNEEMYADGSTEYRRMTENGDTERRTRPPRAPRVLASAVLLSPFLRGGDYEVTEVRERNRTTLFVLQAEGTENGSAVLDGLPDGAQSVESYRSTMVVDAQGRIRSLEAVVGFVIGGTEKTHHLQYELQRLALRSVDRPDWVPANNSSGRAPGLVDSRSPGSIPLAWPDGTLGDSGVPAPHHPSDRGPQERYCNRFVVSTSGWRA